MVADNVCSQAGAKNNADFSKYLTVATDMFFTLSNDEDADIRLLAGLYTFEIYLYLRYYCFVCNLILEINLNDLCPKKNIFIGDQFLYLFKYILIHI